MRARGGEPFLATAAGEAVVGLLTDWWIDGEQVKSSHDLVDHQAGATRVRYTRAAFDTRLAALAMSGRGEFKAAGACFDAFAAWATQHPARQLERWLRELLAKATDPVPPGWLRSRVQREITEAIQSHGVGPGRRHGGGGQKFDASADLDYVLESSHRDTSLGFSG